MFKPLNDSLRDHYGRRASRLDQPEPNRRPGALRAADVAPQPDKQA